MKPRFSHSLMRKLHLFHYCSNFAETALPAVPAKQVTLRPISGGCGVPGRVIPNQPYQRRQPAEQFGCGHFTTIFTHFNILVENSVWVRKLHWKG